jgi:hypothetical protein
LYLVLLLRDLHLLLLNMLQQCADEYLLRFCYDGWARHRRGNLLDRNLVLLRRGRIDLPE